MLGCLVMVSSATAKAVFEEWGGCVPGHLPAVRRHIVRLSGLRRKS